MKTIFIGPVVNLLFRPWVKGMDNVPATGPAVLVSNHLSFSDSIFLPLAVPRPVSFLAKSEYFTGKGIKGKLTAMFFRLANQLPMDRSGGAASASSLRAGIDVLENGGLLGIYPEGTRSPDGRLYRGKTGVAKLVLTTGVPVIPVAMIGTDKVQPIGRRLPNIRRIGIIVGEPLDFSRYAGLENDRFVQRSVTDEIMYELMRLSGQEYVDVYASTVKEKLANRKAEARSAAVRLPDGGPVKPVAGAAETAVSASTTGKEAAQKAGSRKSSGNKKSGAKASGAKKSGARESVKESGVKKPGTVTVIGSGGRKADMEQSVAGSVPDQGATSGQGAGDKNADGGPSEVPRSHSA